MSLEKLMKQNLQVFMSLRHPLNGGEQDGALRTVAGNLSMRTCGGQHRCAHLDSLLAYTLIIRDGAASPSQPGNEAPIVIRGWVRFPIWMLPFQRVPAALILFLSPATEAVHGPRALFLQTKQNQSGAEMREVRIVWGTRPSEPLHDVLKQC